MERGIFMETKPTLKTSFTPWIVKWGRGLNLLGVAFCFGPCLALALMGILPPWGALATAIAIQLPMVASAYIYEPISFFAVLGIPGTYMSFLSGNISNLRVPASAIAQEAAGVKEGSDEGTIIATIGIAVSIFINIIILTIGVLLGSWVLSKLPASVTTALNLLLPALFAALLGNYIVKNPKLALFGVPLALFMVLIKNAGWLNFLPAALITPVVVLVSVFGTMTFGVVRAKKQKN